MESNKTIEFIKKVKTITFSDVEKEVGELINNLYLDDGYTNKSTIFELIELCFKSNNNVSNEFSVNATVENYFNLSVVLARENLFNLACLVLEVGLRQYPKEVDLIANFLRYGVSSSDHFPKCPKYFNDLKKIPKDKWGWRAYDFSIDYLRACQTIEDDNNLVEDKEIENLITDFKLRFNKDERPYLSHSEYYRSIQQFDKELEVLKVAVENTYKPSKCSFRLAEIYFKKGEYKRAMELLNECKKYVCDFDSGIDPGSVYVQRAICGMAVYYDDDSLDDESKITLAKGVFNDYRAALVSDARNSQLFRRLSTLKDIFSINSGVLSSD